MRGTVMGEKRKKRIAAFAVFAAVIFLIVTGFVKEAGFVFYTSFFSPRTFRILLAAILVIIFIMLPFLIYRKHFRDVASPTAAVAATLIFIPAGMIIFFGVAMSAPTYSAVSDPGGEHTVLLERDGDMLKNVYINQNSVIFKRVEADTKDYIYDVKAEWKDTSVIIKPTRTDSAFESIIIEY